MGGEVTVYSGLAAVVEAVGGMLDISSKLTPGICMGGRPGISMPRMGGIPPPIRLPISEDIMVEEEEEELENEEDDIDDEPIFIDDIPPIIFPIILSMSRLFISGIPPIPPIKDIPPPIGGIDIIPPGIGPPDDIIVDEDDDEEDD